MKWINRRKTNLVTYIWEPHKDNETQGQVKQLRLIYHPEQRNEIGT